jgi:hypothetical protein
LVRVASANVNNRFALGAEAEGRQESWNLPNDTYTPPKPGASGGRDALVRFPFGTKPVPVIVIVSPSGFNPVDFETVITA